MKKEFDNKKRHRYYGLRVGDIVKSLMYGIKKAKVTSYVFMDNNAVMIKEPGKLERKVVAEWMSIVTKVEDQ